jgi:hypothetical protein
MFGSSAILMLDIPRDAVSPALWEELKKIAPMTAKGKRQQEKAR